jgi:hypothetical protein
MTEVVAAAGILISLGIFVAHAFDAYRTSRRAFSNTVKLRHE